MLAPQHLATTCAQIDRWYSALPEPKPETFTCPELCCALGRPMQVLHLPLLVLGWDRRPVWSRRHDGRRTLRVLYAPPGYQVPRPKRGRPCLDLRPLLGLDGARSPCLA